MKTTLSIRSANLLFLISIVLVLTLGSLMQLLSLEWGLIGTEVLCIGLPAVLFLRLQHVPLRQGLRLNPISWKVVLLCLALGIGGWLFAGFIDIYMMQITGQPPVDIPANMLPNTAFEGILYAIALAIFAPLGEETLFRGVIQGAYEKRRSAVIAVIFSSLMFAFYHFRLTGLPALLPLAFLLGYVVWRTQSLYAGMLIHFANNGVSAGFSLVSLFAPNTEFPFPFPSVWTALLGLVILAVGLWGLRRITTAPAQAALPAGAEAPAEAPVEAPSAAARQPGLLAVYWPLVVAALLYVVVAGATLLVALNPQLTAQKGVSFYPGALDHTETYDYRAVNRAGDNVGSVHCTVRPVSAALELNCKRQVQGYEIQVGSSTWIDNTNTAEWTVRWDAGTMQLDGYTYKVQFDNGGGYHSEVNGQQLITINDGKTLSAERAAELFVEEEWPWRGGNMILSPGENRMINFGRLLQWDNATNASQPVVTEELLRMQVGETLKVPAGEFSTVKVSIGGKSTAWYTLNDPRRLVRYDDGINFYELESASP